MPTQLAKITGANFRALIDGLLKFPPVAEIATSEVIHFCVQQGRARASISGNTVAAGSVLAMRELDPFSVDYRALSPFAALCGDEQMVEITASTKDKEVVFVCGKQSLTVPMTAGNVVSKPKGIEPFLIVTEESVRVLKALAAVAEKDESKPDMCCVYVSRGMGMAGNQNCIVTAPIDGMPDTDEMHFPLRVCSCLEAGDKIGRSGQGLFVMSGCVTTQVPFEVAAISFPVGVVNKLKAAPAELLATLKRAAVSTAFGEAADCVARIPKAQAYITLSFTGKEIELKAQSQTARFRTTLEGTTASDGRVLLPLPEAEDVMGMFQKDVQVLRLSKKGEASLKSGDAQAFFAPVVVS